MIILDPLVRRIPLESDETRYEHEVLAGETEGLQAEHLLGGVVHSLAEVVPDKIQVVLRGFR